MCSNYLGWGWGKGAWIVSRKIASVVCIQHKQQGYARFYLFYTFSNSSNEKCSLCFEISFWCWMMLPWAHLKNNLLTLNRIPLNAPLPPINFILIFKIFYTLYKNKYLVFLMFIDQCFIIYLFLELLLICGMHLFI